MALEVMGKLPEGAKAMLEVPLTFFELLHKVHQLGKVSIDRKRAVAHIPVNPHGRMRFGEVLFPAKSRAALRLLVQIPERRRKDTYQIAVRQIWEREEVVESRGSFRKDGGPRKKSEAHRNVGIAAQQRHQLGPPRVARLCRATLGSRLWRTSTIALLTACGGALGKAGSR